MCCSMFTTQTTVKNLHIEINQNKYRFPNQAESTRMTVVMKVGRRIKLLGFLCGGAMAL